MLPIIKLILIPVLFIWRVIHSIAKKCDNLIEFSLNTILLIVSIVLKAILSPVLFIWGLIGSFAKRETKIWFKELGLANDRYGNVLGKYTFNDVLGRGFGNGKETISSRLGKNEMFGGLKALGPDTTKVLNWFEKDHCKKSIDFII